MSLKDLKTERLVGATVVEEPVFKFEAPKFKKKLKLPKATENPRSAGYLTARQLDP